LSLESFGQSVWLDFLRRNALDNGDIQRLIEQDGVSGLTSNPSIFEKAIAGSHDYDNAIRSMALEGKSIGEIYEALTIEDIQRAADLFRPIYDRLEGRDGYVSLEVSPKLAHDTAGTLAEARHLWTAVNRPNLLIKVPGTREGLPAIQQLIGEEINVNVTLLFGLPLLAGVLLSAGDALLVLWMGRYGMRAVESLILGFITTIGGCFLLELIYAKPNLHQVALGAIPWLDGNSLYVAVGILGATVMPHNLYLHSSLVQTRQIGTGQAAKRSACRFNLLDSAIALNGAMLVNVAILVLAGAIFFTRGIVVTEIQQAHQLLAPLLGTSVASLVFAIALICSGQSSTITGTMAGQIVMEGFLNFRMKPWLRRFITRAMAVTPAALVIWLSGERPRLS